MILDWNDEDNKIKKKSRKQWMDGVINSMIRLKCKGHRIIAEKNVHGIDIYCTVKQSSPKINFVSNNVLTSNIFS